MIGAVILLAGFAGYAALPCVMRDGRGRIARSAAARRAFVRANPCPDAAAGPRCRGYIVDHVIPLKRCGADDSGNMQWQTIEEARAKDRVE